MNNFREVEINFCNVCTANCFVCSKEHGSGNIRGMEIKVFQEIKKQLKDCQFDIIQTSGNGDAFLNNNYLSYIIELRESFPKKDIRFYSNFYLFNKEKTDYIIKNNLYNAIYTRIDTLKEDIFFKSTHLAQDIVFKNIKYFISKNINIKFTIMYLNLAKYFERCQVLLGKNPLYNPFNTAEIDRLKNEYDDIKKYFGNKCEYMEIIPSLWAERKQALKNEKVCPKINLFNNIIWIHPDGNVSLCGYDDRQCDLTVGNIFENNLLEIWNSERRKELIRKIQNREIKEYPCINPLCCSMDKLERLI